LAFKIILKLYHGSTVEKAEFELAHRLVVGRVPSAEIRIDHPDIANVHSIIEVDEVHSRVQIIDVSGPGKGMKVNGAPVQEFTLTSADRVQIGPVELSLAFERFAVPVQPGSAESKHLPPVKPEITFNQPARPVPTVPPTAGGPPPPKPKAPPKPVPPSFPEPLPPSPPAQDFKVGKAGEETVVTVSTPLPRSDRFGDVIEVTQMIGSEVLDVVTFPENHVVTVGEGLDSDFTVPMDAFGVKNKVAFVETTPTGMALHLDPDHMEGALRVQKKLLSLRRAKEEGLLKAGTGGGFGYLAHLSHQDFAKIGLGPVTFLVQKVPQPPRPPRAPLIDWDDVLKRVVGVSGVVWICLTGLVSFIPVDRDVVAEEAMGRVFQRVLVLKEPKIKEVVVQRFNLEPPPTPAPEAKLPPKPKVGVGNEGEGTRAAGEEGKRGRMDLPRDAKGVTEPRRQKRALVSPTQQGLLGALTTSDVGAQLTTLISKGGKVEESLEGVGGKRLESGAGTAGKGLRGTGLGGSGESAQISGLGTRGRGGGAAGYGEGAVLGKGVGTVLGIGDGQAVDGQITKEEIRRVVMAHQAELIGCYQLQLSRFPQLRGDIELAWVINTDGSVAGILVNQAEWVYKDGPLSLPNLNQCISSKIQSWTFPQPRGGPARVSKYPFNFSASQ
jgi:hypothetical protein